MLLLIDNYDSFTYNLYQYLAELGAEVQVYRNDEITLEQAEALAPDQIVISPGPCTPRGQASRTPSSNAWGRASPRLAFAWGISASVKCSAGGWCVRLRRCMAKRRRFTIRSAASFAGCRRTSQRRAITASSLNARRCPLRWKSSLKATAG